MAELLWLYEELLTHYKFEEADYKDIEYQEKLANGKGGKSK